MPRWRLLLSPPAVSTSPSRSRLPRRPSSSSHHRAVPRRRVAVAPSTAVAPHRPSPSIHHHAVHRRPSPLFSRSIAAALALSLAVEEQSRRPLPSRSRRAVPCRRGAVAPSITVKDRCCVMRRPLLLLLILLRSRPDLLPVGGVAVLPLTIRVHCSRFPLPSLPCSLPPPSLLPCVPSPPPITLISLLPLPSKRPLHPLSSSPRGCSLILDPIAPSPTPMPASPSRPCSLRLRCPLRQRRPPTPPPPSSVVRRRPPFLIVESLPISTI